MFMMLLTAVSSSKFIAILFHSIKKFTDNILFLFFKLNCKNYVN